MLLESSPRAWLLLACLCFGCPGASAIDEDATRARISELRSEIARHDDLYYRQAAPEISDFEYDALRRELAALESALPDEAASDALAFLGDDRSGRFPTARHIEPMLSLDKAYSKTEFEAFHARCVAEGGADAAFSIEPKIDGIAISLVYERGRFVRAVTRGDGTEGDDITENARTIPTLPETLRARAGASLPERVELRGELYFAFADFDRINRERVDLGEEAFANPRNLAAGTAKLADPAEVAARGLSLAVFGYGAWEPEASEPTSQSAFLDQARAWGLPTAPGARLARGAAEAFEAIRSLERERDALGFPVDGAVAKIDAVSAQRALGLGASAPRWAIAYKFAPTRVAARLEGIDFQIGRSGALTPVARFERTVLGGSAVERASLYNFGYIQRRDLRLGDFVFLEKAGAVIPRIAAVDLSRRLPDSRPFEVPESCPSCEGPTLFDGSILRCPNARCPERTLRRVAYFVSGDALDIEGLGEAWVARLREAGLLRDIPDLYRIRRDELLLLGDDIEVSADKLLAAIERSKRAELWRWVNGLGISGVGAARAQELASALEGLGELAREGGAAEAAARAGLGTAAARAVTEHFEEEANRLLVAELVELGARPR